MTQALFDSYLRGLRALQKTLGAAHPQRGTTDVYYQRLAENIDRTTRYGETDALSAARAEVLDHCNRLCREITGRPFANFCQSAADVTRLAHARLHTLPAPPADFIGREKELEALLRAVEGGSAPRGDAPHSGAAISGVRGMGGVGKTTLALKLAEVLAPRYPDAQFYLDLRGVDPAPLTPAAVMMAIVRAYHPTARLPEDEAQLQPLYRAVLDGQRALLLLDNAKDAAQLRPLLPPDFCLLLVTSRQRFSLPGLCALDLDALPKLEAEALLRDIAPRVGDRAADLARRSLIACVDDAGADRASADTAGADTGGRYALHNLARLWAGEQATADERAARAWATAARKAPTWATSGWHTPPWGTRAAPSSLRAGVGD